jgi:hypothetical protein
VFTSNASNDMPVNAIVVSRCSYGKLSSQGEELLGFSQEILATQGLIANDTLEPMGSRCRSQMDQRQPSQVRIAALSCR